MTCAAPGWCEPRLREFLYESRPGLTLCSLRWVGRMQQELPRLKANENVHYFAYPFKNKKIDNNARPDIFKLS
jgi:hypothetical protein